MTAKRPERRLLAAVGAVALLASGCSITRVYEGMQLRADPQQELLYGRTTKSDVLRVFGPPAGIGRQHDGDVFVYRYVRRNAESLQLEEPVFTGIEFFTYTRSREKADLLVILFDEEGVLRSYGWDEGTAELDWTGE